MNNICYSGNGGAINIYNTDTMKIKECVISSNTATNG